MNAWMKWGLWGGGLVAMVLAVRLLIPTDEARIERQVRDMADWASFDGSKGNIRMQTDLQRLVGQFLPEAQIVLEELGRSMPISVFGPDQIQQLGTAAKQYTPSLQVKIHDVNVDLAAPGVAVVNFTATAQTSGGREDFQVQEFQMQMRKVEAQWRVLEIRALPLMGRR